MKFITYISSLLSFFNDRRIINNIEKMIQKMIEKKTTRLFSITDNKKEYNRYKSLLDGSYQSILDNQKISHVLRKNSVEAMSGQKQIILIHDPCDIRSIHANKLENLGKVRREGEKGYQRFELSLIRLPLIQSGNKYVWLM
jgi:Zn-dependent M16 (insulinase) family peptidase